MSIMPVVPIKPMVDVKKAIRTLAAPEPREINVERAELMLVGTPHDITRIKAACEKMLDQAARERDSESVRRVHVRAPQEDEK